MFCKNCGKEIHWEDKCTYCNTMRKKEGEVFPQHLAFISRILADEEDYINKEVDNHTGRCGVKKGEEEKLKKLNIISGVVAIVAMLLGFGTGFGLGYFVMKDKVAENIQKQAIESYEEKYQSYVAQTEELKQENTELKERIEKLLSQNDKIEKSLEQLEKRQAAIENDNEEETFELEQSNPYEDRGSSIQNNLENQDSTENGISDQNPDASQKDEQTEGDNRYSEQNTDRNNMVGENGGM